MSTPKRRLAAVLAAVVAAGLSGCGDTGDRDPSAAATSSSASHASAASGEGEWLLRFATSGGPDGEKVGAAYVRLDPATGAASVRKLPTLTTADASPDEEVLLVSADHAWAIQDTGVPRDQARTGRLVLYSLTDDSTQTVDIRALTGKRTLRATGWAFDPTDGDVLRVVDSEHTVWKVDLAAKTATQEATLHLREGWIFGNGFDKNTGEPYVESIDSDDTEPAGNGDSDTRAVERQGGSLFRYDGTDLEGLPKPPCGFAGGFRFDDGVAWLFCADTPSIATYQAHPGGTSWHQYGAASPNVVPAGAVELSFALPPVH